MGPPDPSDPGLFGRDPSKGYMYNGKWVSTVATPVEEASNKKLLDDTEGKSNGVSSSAQISMMQDRANQAAGAPDKLDATDALLRKSKTAPTSSRRGSFLTGPGGMPSGGMGSGSELGTDETGANRKKMGGMSEDALTNILRQRGW